MSGVIVEDGRLKTRRDDAAIERELTAAGLTEAYEIGRGGFGVVYRCLQPSLDRTVAVKVLTGAIDDENRSRFFREQRAMGRLTGHPNIVNVLEVGSTASGHPFIVMPYHPLDSLDTLIRHDGPLSPDQVLRLGIRIAGAVETAHRLGILHRDIKPGNILLSSYGEPALTDFGIAHITGGFETAKDTITASPAFTAPEILRGDPPTPASDIYGIGATLFCALTGHAAFERRSGEQVVAQFVRITRNPVPDLREHGISDDIAAAIERAMARDPRDRPGSAVEFGDELRAIQARNDVDVDEMALPIERPVAPLGRRDAASTASTEESSGHRTARQSRPGNLPLELTSFIGRQDELSEAKNMFRTARLVTLTGIGGVGKTRLALRIAADMRNEFPHGVWLAEFGEVLDESLLVDVIARALGLRISHSEPMEEIVDFLIDRKLLIVLDNCEHVIAPVARFAEAVVRACPDISILTTTREPLNIAGESVLRVPPLSTPDADHEPALMASPNYDAIALFEERAATAVPGFELSDDNVDTVVQICRQLDGLPLPLELAAAQLRAMSLDQIAQRLTDRYKLLTHGSRAAPARQRTLRLCVEWSYDLCTPLERRIWVNLSTFVGNFELDAAEFICEEIGQDELLDGVFSLVDKSVLVRQEHGSAVGFRMLETIREFGRMKARESGDYAKLRRRHHEWYRRLVLDAERDWISVRQLGWIARLGREQSNLREAMEFAVLESDEREQGAALELATALFPFWLSRNLLSEGRFWLDRALSSSPARASKDRVKALYADSVLAGMQGDFSAGSNLIVQGELLVAEMSDPVSDARIAHANGILALYRGDVSQAAERLEEALEVFSARDEVGVRVWILMMLGVAWELSGNSERSVACHREVLEITESRGESVYRSYSLWGMGIAVFRQGDVVRADQYLGECLRLCRLIDEPLVAAVCLETAAWIAGRQEDFDRAAMLLGAADSLGSAVGSSPLLFHQLRTYHTECEDSARSSFGDKEFRSRRRKGARMGAEAAITLALTDS
ncbi:MULTISPECIES: protein kinase [Rhodococcus]|uniref:Protein kinase n=1 Tax=Rhodococcus jostii TaxID=132919 RepID=A0ABU4CGW7_RHOJO|nr:MULTISPECIES: protein kinase [Rhodococcus]MDI9974166.1 protein kinase [Rhodococcus sp. IEGM 1307]MDV6282505.1 protein kinase [Rhodococcus jostii]